MPCLEDVLAGELPEEFTELLLVASVRIIDLVSHTTYVVCVNLIHKWRNLILRVFAGNVIFSLMQSVQVYLSFDTNFYDVL